MRTDVGEIRLTLNLQFYTFLRHFKIIKNIEYLNNKIKLFKYIL